MIQRGARFGGLSTEISHDESGGQIGPPHQVIVSPVSIAPVMAQNSFHDDGTQE
jgi:hypothetical protein